MDRNRQLVPDSRSLPRVRALTTGLCSGEWYSEHSGVSVKQSVEGPVCCFKSKSYPLLKVVSDAKDRVPVKSPVHC